MSRIIVVTSGKGGVGKSTICVNLGAKIAKDYKVCLIDADLGLKNLDCILGIENRVIYDIEDVIEGRVELRKALVNDKRYENLFVLPACRSLDVSKVDVNHLKKIVLNLEESFDFIIIDCPAGIEKGFYNAISLASEAIVVCSLDIASLRDADKVVGILNKNGFSSIKLIISKYNPLLDNKNAISMNDAIDILNIPLLGVVYYNEEVSSLTNNGVLAIDKKKSILNDCFENIKLRLLGSEVEICKFKKKTILEKIFN